MSYCPNIYTVSKLQKNARKTVKYSTCSAEKGFYEGKVSYHFLPPVLEVKFLPAYYFSSLFWENTLWYTTAFSSNSSSLRPVFSTNTELLSKNDKKFCSSPILLGVDCCTWSPAHDLKVFHFLLIPNSSYTIFYREYSTVCTKERVSLGCAKTKSLAWRPWCVGWCPGRLKLQFYLRM